MNKCWTRWFTVFKTVNGFVDFFQVNTLKLNFSEQWSTYRYWGEHNRQNICPFPQRSIKCIADCFFVNGHGSACFSFRHNDTLFLDSKFFNDEIPFCFDLSYCLKNQKNVCDVHLVAFGSLGYGNFWSRRKHRTFEKICIDCTNDVSLL